MPIRISIAPVLSLITDLGPGETEVLALALEMVNAIVIIDDGPARRIGRNAGNKRLGIADMR